MFRLSLPTRRAALAASSFLVPFGIALCAPVGARAQTAPRVEALPEINIVANAQPTPTDETGSSVTILTGEQLQRTQRRTAPEALMSAPGLNVVQTGGPGGAAAVFMRGTNSNHVKVLVDGVDVSDPSSVANAVDFSRLLTTDIDRIEILRGPQSGLYGSDSIGGVIAITTKRGQGKPKLSIMSEAGAFGTLNQSARLSGAHEAVDYAFALSRMGVNQVRATPSLFFPPTGAPVWAAPGADAPNVANNVTGSARLGVRLSDTVRLNATGRYTDAKLWFPYSATALATGQSTSNNRQASGRIEGEWTALDGRLKSVFGVSHLETRNYTLSPRTVFGAIAPTFYTGARTKFDWRSEFAVTPDHRVMAGVERVDETFRSPAYNLATQTPAAGRAGATSAFGQYTGRFADRFFLAANIRHDRDDAYGGHTSWRIAPAFHAPVLNTVFKASYGTGFKAPSLSQRYASYYSPFYNFYANPNLRPEDSRGFDIGFEQPLFDDQVRFGATYFNNRIRNLIQGQAIAGTWDYTNVNIGAARTYGYEAFVALTLAPTLTVRADHTFTVARDVTPVATAAGLAAEAARRLAEGTSFPDLLRRPRHKTSLQATWRPTEALTLTGAVTRLSGWFDYDRVQFVRRRQAGYTLVNVAADYKVADGVAAFARIDNLFNARYENPNGYLGPGRGAVAGVRLDF